MAYTVVKGDTLKKIAAANNMTLAQLIALNPQIKNPDQIQVGQSVNTSSSTTKTGTTTTTTDAGGGVTTSPRKPGVPTAEDKAGTGVGGGGTDPETQLTILTGKEMKWYFDTSTGKWYVSYGLPNSNREMIFEADPDQMDALFGNKMRPTNYENKTFTNILAGDNTTFAGNVAEMEGKGSFESEVQKVIDLALDNGKLPSWMGSGGEALDILFISQAEGKSNDWVYDQFSKLDTFKARFPGVEHLKNQGNLTLAEAVTGFLEFEAGLTQAINGLGLGAGMGVLGSFSSVAGNTLPRPPGGVLGDPTTPTNLIAPKPGTMGTPAAGQQVTPAMVGALLTKGWGIQAATDALKTYKRMQDFAPAMEAFNKILVAKGMAPLIDISSYYNFMSGQAPAGYYDTYEASSLAEAATQAGLGEIFQAEDAIDAALAGNFDLGNATEGMQKAAQLLLRLRGEIGVEKYGLNREDLIDASLGLKPSSGVTESELFDAVNRATLAARANLQARSKPYMGFSKSGKPQTASLGTLRQES